jgi:hypothetical protein
MFHRQLELYCRRIHDRGFATSDGCTQCAPMCRRLQAFMTPIGINRSVSSSWRNEQGPLPSRVASTTWYRQNRHYLDGFAWEDCEVRMVFE